MVAERKACPTATCANDVNERFATLDEARNSGIAQACDADPKGCQAVLSRLIADEPANLALVERLRKSGEVSDAAVIGFVVGQSNDQAKMALASSLSQDSAFEIAFAGTLLGMAAGGGARPGATLGRSGAKGIDKIFEAGRTPKASELKEYATAQGWKPSQTHGGPLKYVDENGVPRVTIKQGSSRAPRSSAPHVEFKDAAGQRTDAFGNPVTRKSPDNHTSIEFDL